MDKIKEISSGSTMRINYLNFMEKESESLFSEATKILIQSSQNISPDCGSIEYENSSGNWEEFENLIPI